MASTALRDIDWFREPSDMPRYLCALAAGGVAMLGLISFLLLSMPNVALMICLALLLASAIYMHVLAADRLQLLRHNSAEGQWQHYKAVWWLYFGGPLLARR